MSILLLLTLTFSAASFVLALIARTQELPFRSWGWAVFILSAILKSDSNT